MDRSEWVQTIQASGRGQIVFPAPSLFSFCYKDGSYMVHILKETSGAEEQIFRLTGFPGTMPSSVEAGHGEREAVSHIVEQAESLCGVPFYINTRQMILFVYEKAMSAADARDASRLIECAAEALFRTVPVLERLYCHPVHKAVRPSEKAAE